ncbi:MAG: DUF4145 domain-containing protein [Candidatus Odinarchaeota archaeon]
MNDAFLEFIVSAILSQKLTVDDEYDTVLKNLQLSRLLDTRKDEISTRDKINLLNKELLGLELDKYSPLQQNRLFAPYIIWLSGKGYDHKIPTLFQMIETFLMEEGDGDIETTLFHDLLCTGCVSRKLFRKNVALAELVKDKIRKTDIRALSLKNPLGFLIMKQFVEIHDIKLDLTLAAQIPPISETFLIENSSNLAQLRMFNNYLEVLICRKKIKIEQAKSYRRIIANYIGNDLKKYLKGGCSDKRSYFSHLEAVQLSLLDKWIIIDMYVNNYYKTSNWLDFSEAKALFPPEARIGLPQSVEFLLNQVFGLLFYGFYLPANIMLRKILEAIIALVTIKVYGNDDILRVNGQLKNLETRLDILQDEDLLNRRHKARLIGIKWFGDEAAHNYNLKDYSREEIVRHIDALRLAIPDMIERANLKKK